MVMIFRADDGRGDWLRFESRCVDDGINASQKKNFESWAYKVLLLPLTLFRRFLPRRRAQHPKYADDTRLFEILKMLIAQIARMIFLCMIISSVDFDVFDLPASVHAKKIHKLNTHSVSSEFVRFA